MNVPRIVSARALPGYVLRVDFGSDGTRDYDVRPLISRAPFMLLREPAFFRSFVVEPQGHALIWNDDIDIAAYELFRGGQPVTPDSVAPRDVIEDVPAGYPGEPRVEDPSSPALSAGPR